MHLTYRSSPHAACEKFLPALKEAAARLGYQLTQSEADAVDLCFYLDAEGLRCAQADFILPTGEWTSATAELLLAWANERRKVALFAGHRHLLGNLLVILQGRVMLMRLNPPEGAHLEVLESLHQRLNRLYEEMAAIE